MKSNKDIGLSIIYNLVQDNKLQRNKFLRLWSGNSLSSKDLLFCFFQIVKKRHKGFVPHTFFCFLSTKEPYQPNIVSYTKEGTKKMPQREKKSCHEILTLLQCSRMWSIDSSWICQRKHLLVNDHSFL